jgi:hypothetical protein
MTEGCALARRSWAKMSPEYDVTQSQTEILDGKTLVANDLLERVSQLTDIPARDILFEIRRNWGADGEGLSRP